MAQEALLDHGLHEHAQLDLDVDQLQCMFPRNVDSVILEGYGGEGATKLVCLDENMLAS